jgi:outer membrane protein, multidrug efflux system
MKSSRVCVALVAALVCNGCMVGPDYKPPIVKVDPHFGELGSQVPTTQASRVTSLAPPSTKWWTNFNDPQLDRLIERAMKGNLDLQSAQSRLVQARYQAVIAGAALYPEINADGGYNHALGSKNITIPAAAFGAGAKPAALRAKPAQATAGGVASAEPAGPQSPLGQGGLPNVVTDVYQVGFDASWEIDVFGGTRRSMEAANADTEAAREDANAVLISMQAEVARNYIELRGFQRQETIARQNLGLQRDTLELTRSKYQNGFVTQLDVARQEAQVAQTSAEIPPLVSGEREAIHSMSILLGEDPNSLSAELSIDQPIPLAPPSVPVGLPSDLLRRRPDIRRAERQIAAANARIGVATADLFPKFTITGLLGLDSTTPKHLFDYSSHYYSLVPGVTWPIFDAGQINANIHVQDELTKQAVLNYRQTVLTALSEVENSLVAYQTEQLRRIDLIDAVSASREAFDLARQQYQQGVIDFLTVLDAQRSMLDAEDDLAQSDRAVSDDLVQLYKALGGGWENQKS